MGQNTEDTKDTKQDDLKVENKKENKEIVKWVVAIVVFAIVLIGLVMNYNNNNKVMHLLPKDVDIVEEGYEYHASVAYEDGIVADDESGEVILTEEGEPINIPVIKVTETIKLEEIKDDTKPEAVFGEAANYEDDLETE